LAETNDRDSGRCVRRNRGGPSPEIAAPRSETRKHFSRTNSNGRNCQGSRLRFGEGSGEINTGGCSDAYSYQRDRRYALLYVARTVNGGDRHSGDGPVVTWRHRLRNAYRSTPLRHAFRDELAERNAKRTLYTYTRSSTGRC